MANWRPDFNPDHLYFVTTKAADHEHLFQQNIVKRMLTDSLDCMCLRKLLTLYAFVIMPNHIHLIIQSPPDNPVANVIRGYKRHTADRLIRQYRAEENQKTLDILSAKARSSKQRHKVWENGYNAKSVFSAEFLHQKMTYIHNNPCQPRWNLVSEPVAYVWSSARFYLTDHPSIIPVKNAGRLMV